MLNISALERAFQQLTKSLEFSTSLMAQEDRELFEQFRSAAVQAFEYTYELTIKLIRRYLENEASSAEAIDQLSYRELIRLAARKGLIEDPVSWFSYRELRNKTSHGYNEFFANEVYNGLATFKEEVEAFIIQLRARGGDNGD